MSKRKSLTLIITVIVAILIIGYVIFNSRLLVSGPQIIIKSPESGSSFEDPFIELMGIAKNTAFISLDGNPIYVDENGNFDEKLLLSPGTSIIKLNATDRFNRETETTLWYTYKPEEKVEILKDVASSSEEISEENTSTSSLLISE